jgi:hypothetical protein
LHYMWSALTLFEEESGWQWMCQVVMLHLKHMSVLKLHAEHMVACQVMTPLYA